MSVGAKIRKHRKEQGLSQADLAEMTSLSLRTIQRIENEKNTPRGYTLRVMAEALELDVMNLAEPAMSDSQKPVQTLEWINLSVLSFLIIPFGNLIFPTLAWRKHSYQEEVDRTGRRLVNFQITWSIITYTLLAVSPFFNDLVPTTFPVIFMVLIGAWLLNIYTVLSTARKLRSGDFEVCKTAFGFL